MVWCEHCQETVEAETYDGASSCAVCGAVLDDAAFSSEVTFTKGAGGESAADGQRVTESGVARGMGSIGGGRNYGSQIESKEKSLMRGKAEIQSLVSQLRIQPATTITEGAHRLYGLALGKNFTRGRRTAQVAAACIYVMCREEHQPFMLIDFSDALQINVFVLGGVYIQLIQLLRLQDEPAFSRPTDPSLYLDRYAAKLGLEPRARMQAVVSTSLQLVKSMKRDWMQTGRRPAGICGAALFIALHIHGFQKTKKEVVRVVNVGVTTLVNRLREFGATETGELTNAQLKDWDRGVSKELEAMVDAPQHVPLSLIGPRGGASDATALAAVGDATDGGDREKGYTRGCPHIGQGTPPTPAFAHDLCRGCFTEFLNTTGGRHAGALPPAFTKNRRKEERLQKEADEQAEAELMLQGNQPGQKQLLLTAGGESIDNDRSTSLVAGVGDDMMPGSRMSALTSACLGAARQQVGSSGTKRATRSGSRMRQASTSDAPGLTVTQLASLHKGNINGGNSGDGNSSGGSRDSSAPEAECGHDTEPARQRRRLNSGAATDSTTAQGYEERGEARPQAENDGDCIAEGDGPSDTREQLRSAVAADIPGAADGGRTSGQCSAGLGPHNADVDVAGGGGCSNTAAAATPSESPTPAANLQALDTAADPQPRESPKQTAGNGETSGGERTRPRAPSGAAAAPAQRRVHFASDAAEGSNRETRQDREKGEGESEEGASTGMELAIVPARTGDEDGSGEELAEVEAELPPETFSDLDDDEIDTFLLSNEERDLKERVWTAMNEDWLVKQAAKEEAQAAGEKIQAERQAEADKQLAAAGGDVASAPKRGRGRPVGSKTRNHTADLTGEPSDSAGQAAMRMLENRKLSSKVNYNVLADLFSDANPASGGVLTASQKGSRPGSIAPSARSSQSSHRPLGRGISSGARGRQPGLLDDITSLCAGGRGGSSRPAGRGGFAPRVKR